MLAYFCDLLFSRGAAELLVIRIPHIKLILITALRFINFAFFVVEDDLALDKSLRINKSILVYSL